MWIGPSSYFDLFPFIGGADLDLGLFLFGRFFGLSEPIAVVGAGLIVLGLWGFGLYCGLAFFFSSIGSYWILQRGRCCCFHSGNLCCCTIVLSDDLKMRN